MMVKEGKLVSTAVFALIVVLTCVSSASTANAAVDEWPMYRHDPAHSGYSTDGPTDYVKPLWNFTTGAQVWSSPAVVNGRVFVGSRDGNLYCFDAFNGSKLWSYQTGMVIQFSSPAVAQGCVYIGGDMGALFCLDAETGMMLWAFPTEGMIRSSATYLDGLLYFGSWDFNVYCINASDGTKVWSHRTYGTIDSSPAVADGILYIGSADSGFYALNASNGERLWVQYIGSIGASPTIYNDLVYIGSSDGALYAFNRLTGERVWKYQTEDTIFSSPASWNGYLYVGSEDNFLYCLEAATGDKVWASQTGYWVWGSPAVANGYVYVGSEDGNIYCFDALTGATKWGYATGNAVDSSPAIAYGNLYIGSEDCLVYAFTNSPVRWESETSKPLPLNVILFDILLVVIFIMLGFIIVRYIRSNIRAQVKPETEKAAGGAKAWVSRHTDAVCIAILLAVSSVFYVYLGSGSLWAADEQTYSQWAYHMMTTGDYLRPWAFGGLATWMGKPPLLMALMSVSYQIFGVNNFGARIWSAFFGSLCLIMMFYLGKKLYSRDVGFWSAIVLTSFVTFFMFARHAMTDIPMLFFILGSFYFLLVSETDKRPNLYAALSGVCFGMAMMIKQMEALLIPVIIFVYLLLSRRSLRFLVSKRFTLVWAVGFLVFLSWLVFLYNEFGWQVWDWFFVYNAVTRSMAAIEGHVGSFTFYFDYLINNENFVWLAILPFAAAFSAFKAFVKRSKADILVLEWMLVVVVVFTLAQTKLYWYIIPALPAFALAISSFLCHVYMKIRLHRAKKASQNQPANQ